MSRTSTSGPSTGTLSGAASAGSSGASSGAGVSSQPDVILLNGVAAQPVSWLDRGLHYGDGLFETIACLKRRPRFLPLHLERLAHGCERLGMPPAECGELGAEVRELARGVSDRCVIKILMTRGAAVGRGYGATGDEKATRITFRYAWPHEDPAWSREGVQVRTARLRLGENPALAGLKHCNRLEQILARAEWTDPKISEALLYSSSGMLVSGTMSNVFIVQGDVLRTPRLDVCGVAGIMRRVVMREALRAGVGVEEAVLHADDVACADEMFLTNARIGIWPVRALDGRGLMPGPVTHRMQQWLAPMLEEPADA